MDKIYWIIFKLQFKKFQQVQENNSIIMCLHSGNIKEVCQGHMDNKWWNQN